MALAARAAPAASISIERMVRATVSMVVLPQTLMIADA
jgi:hypothetical protein